MSYSEKRAAAMHGTTPFYCLNVWMKRLSHAPSAATIALGNRPSSLSGELTAFSSNTFAVLQSEAMNERLNFITMLYGLASLLHRIVDLPHNFLLGSLLHGRQKRC